MILIICILVGLVLRVASDRQLAGLAHVGLRGETVLVVLLVVQVLPSAFGLTGAAARVAYWIWIATFPCLVTIACVNRRNPGMAMLGLGLLLNLLVILLNGGMPVSPLAIAAVKPDSVVSAIAATDFVHVAGTATARLPWLSDILPIAGPTWLRSVASPGDCLLFAGITAFLATAEPEPAKSRVAE